MPLVSVLPGYSGFVSVCRSIPRYPGSFALQRAGPGTELRETNLTAPSATMLIGLSSLLDLTVLDSTQYWLVLTTLLLDTMRRQPTCYLVQGFGRA